MNLYRISKTKRKSSVVRGPIPTTLDRSIANLFNVRLAHTGESLKDRLNSKDVEYHQPNDRSKPSVSYYSLGEPTRIRRKCTVGNILIDHRDEF